MNVSQIYILVTLVVFIVIAVSVVLAKKQAQKPPSKLAIIAFLFIVAGVVLGGDNRLANYSLMGIGLVFAVVDILKKTK